MRTGVAGVVLAGWLAGAGPGGRVAGADEKPAPPAKGYELRVVTFGDAYHGIRFKPATGESWRILNGLWEKLDEAAAPPAGEYDITLIPAASLLAVRIDRATGATWLLRKGKWNPVKEPPPPKPGAPAKPAGPGYALRHIVVGDQLHAVRFHTKTGEAWHLGGDTFEPLAEFGKVPAGDFDITLIAGDKDWMGFRLDKKAGTTWVLQANIWQVVAEPELE
jgi:hypothetical protein